MVYSCICDKVKEMCLVDAPSPIQFDPSIMFAPAPSTNDLFQEWLTVKTMAEQARLAAILQSRFSTVAEFEAALEEFKAQNHPSDVKVGFTTTSVLTCLNTDSPAAITKNSYGSLEDSRRVSLVKQHDRGFCTPGHLSQMRAKALNELENPLRSVLTALTQYQENSYATEAARGNMYYTIPHLLIQHDGRSGLFEAGHPIRKTPKRWHGVCGASAHRYVGMDRTSRCNKAG